MIQLLRLLVIMCAAFTVTATPAFAIAGRVIAEAVERAAKTSGKELVGAKAQKAATESLERLVKTHGEDALKVVEHGGLEMLETISRFGDEAVELGMAASPNARRVLALNADELLPLARRVGVEAVELEAKAPGLSSRVFTTFGDDAGKTVATAVPAEDVPRLLKYAEKSDSPDTRELLLKCYQQEGKSLFERIPAKLVLASGLSAAMLKGAHDLTAPTRAIAQSIEDSPELAEKAIFYAIVSAALVTLILGIVFLRRKQAVSNTPSGKAALATTGGLNDLTASVISARGTAPSTSVDPAISTRYGATNPSEDSC